VNAPVLDRSEAVTRVEESGVRPIEYSGCWSPERRAWIREQIALIKRQIAEKNGCAFEGWEGTNEEG
jgi:hypothetical protein